MKLTILSAALFLMPAFGGAPNTSAQGDSKPLRVVTLQGSPYQRGLTHGQTLKKEIHSLVQTWKDDMGVRYKMPADKFISRFLENTNFEPAIKKWMPDLLDEVKGISDGSGLDFKTSFVFQLADEIWAHGDEIAADHCTAVGIRRRGDEPTLLGQTMDIPWLYQGYQTLLRIKHENSRLESLVLTAPGMIGFNGMNNSPLAINCNTLLQLKNTRDGLPVAFIVRGVLEKRSFEEAIAFIRSVRHASGQNYLIGGIERVGSFECSAGRITEYAPYQDGSVTYHTNHPLINDDYTVRYAAFVKSGRKYRSSSTDLRFASVEKRIKNRSQAFGLNLLKEILSSRDTENGPVSNDLTYACTLMVLSVKPELHIAVGRPDQNAFRVFRF